MWRYEEAMNEFNMAIELGPNNPDYIKHKEDVLLAGALKNKKV